MTRRKFDPGLYLVTDRTLAGRRSVEEVVCDSVRGGVSMVQLREKGLDTREFVELARRLKTEFPDLPLIINDRVDVARVAGADGVHVGQRDMAWADARAVLGPDAIIGLSVETIEQAAEAEASDCDYYGVSPIFPTPTKTDVETSWGLDGLRALRRRSQKPLVAIGGIDASNAAAVLAAGADGLAVVSAICAAAEPEAAARALRSIVDNVRRSRP